MRTHLKKQLAALQRYTKTDMTYLTKGGFWVSMSYFIQVGTGVLSTIALANLLPKETLGTYQFILAIAAILSVLTLSGLGTAITRAVAQGHDGMLRSGVRTKFKWSIGIVVASGATALYYYVAGNNMFALAFLIVGACAPFIESFKLYVNFLHGKEAFKDNTLLGAWRKPLPLLATVLTAYFSNDILLLVFVYFFSNTISFTAVYYSVINKYKPPLQHNGETVAYSKHLTVFRIISRVANNADKILIWHFLGSAMVANFAIAQFATRYSGGILDSLSALVLPKLAKRDLAILQQTLPRKVFLFTCLMFVGALAYTLLVPYLFKYIFPDYLDSVGLAQLLAVTFLFLPRSVYGKALTAHKQLRSQYTLAIVLPCIKIALLTILLPIFDIWGAVYALILSDAVGAITLYTFFKRAKSV